MSDIIDAQHLFQRRPIAPPKDWNELGIRLGENVEHRYIILDEQAQKNLSQHAGGVLRDGLDCLITDRGFSKNAKYHWNEATGEVTISEPKSLPAGTDAVIEERGKVYGDPELSHENIGLEWTGMIQQHYQLRLDHPLPAWLVELMMGGFKLHRSCRTYHEDNYTDFEAYVLKFAKQHQKKAFEKI